MIFVDASAVVAILAQEDDSDQLFQRLEATERRFYSSIAMWEAVVALRRSYRVDDENADRAVATFYKRLCFEIVPIGEKEADLALMASRQYGRGRHPAALNMGDCFAYACAKSVGAALLYKGNDFALTDLAETGDRPGKLG